MLVVILCMVAIPAIGSYFLLRGKARSQDRLKVQVDADVRNRLTSIAMSVEGTVLDGRTLETSHGTMTLMASKAPESFVIDLAKFTRKTKLPGAMTIVRTEDADKVIATKSLQRIVPKDPIVSERYHVLVSDPEEGRYWASVKLAESLKELEISVRARCRLQVSNQVGTVLAFRGLAKTEELRAFYEGSVRVMDALEASIRST